MKTKQESPVHAEKDTETSKLQEQIKRLEQELVGTRQQLEAAPQQMATLQRDLAAVNAALAEQRESAQKAQEFLQQQQQRESEMREESQRAAEAYEVGHDVWPRYDLKSCFFSDLLLLGQAQLGKLQEQLQADHERMKEVEKNHNIRAGDLERQLAAALEQLQVEAGYCRIRGT